MTTPMISRDLTEDSLYQNHHFNKVTGVGTDTVGAGFHTRWDAEDRPATTNGAFWGGGSFRLCVPWSHSRKDITVKGVGSYYETNTFTDFWPGMSFWGSGNTLDKCPPATLAGSAMVNKALVKALEKLKRTEIHLGNFLAEADKTIELVGDTSSEIARQVFNFRARSSAGVWQAIKLWQHGRLPRHLWKCIPASWLAMQYGWSPLLQDVQGAANHLARLSQSQKPLIFTRGQATSEEEVSTPLSTGKVSGNEADIRWRREQKANVTLVYGLNSPTLVQLSQLGLINPAEIVWELTYYSFVVDWFVPVGGWLSALTADVGYQFVTGSLGRRTKVRFKSSAISKNSSGCAPCAPIYTGRRDNYNRTCYTSTPVPGLYVKSPLSLKHAANGIALLAQAFR